MRRNAVLVAVKGIASCDRSCGRKGWGPGWTPSVPVGSDYQFEVFVIL